MDTHTLLLRFDSRSGLLIRSLLSGPTDARRALRVFRRQRRSEPHSCLQSCLQTLCQPEIFPTSDSDTLRTKPLVCLFPVAFQQSLLSFLHLVHPELPQASLLRLLDCLSQEEPIPDPWVSVLVVQLRRDLGAPLGKNSLFTTQCRDKLRGLCKCLKGGGKATGWASYFEGPLEPQPSTSQTGPQVVVLCRKRKSSHVEQDSEPEAHSGQQSKRMKLSLSPAVEIDGSCCSLAAVEGTVGQKDKIESGGDDDDGTDVRVCEDLQQPEGTVFLSNSLPEHVKASIPQIRELLQSEMEEWDQGSVDVFKVLNDCNPSQVELFCEMLRLSETPERILPQLCSCVLALKPDLSHSTAATFIKNLLLGKVLSLSEPASRCLVTAVALLCSRYPRPMCQALIGPVLEEGQSGSAQTELLNRLIDCLDSHYRLLVFQMTFKGIWSEGVLSVIHSLLDKKVELNGDLLTVFTDQLNLRAPQFVTSVKFAKMMLTLLTQYSTHLTAVHQHTLSSCLSSNQTFLKKSLQAALKRITHS
ncbi:hypothetical protein DPEC_G00014310 [Dallia pectoralis]|uniref:Uncharacterized protein n=1 Tax=Dallia pectoralis TaxID=75939 RepID=A0ACC2HN48_DALPE|nr:hypothetical protein DPEC_G00014310 [Dallia pectoralis]